MTNYLTSAGDQYLESEIISAGPVRRVQLLYEGVIKAIGKARVALAARDIPARAFQVNRALDILTELALSLDHSHAAAVSKNLVELYDFAQRALLEGSSKQLDKPFADAEDVLKTVLQGWKAIPEMDVPAVRPVPTSARHFVPTDYGFGDSLSGGRPGSGTDYVG